MPWRRQWVRWGVGLAVATLAYGCASTQTPVACTEIGSPVGISVVVDRDVVAAAAARPTLTLRICQPDCVERTVELQPGSVTVGQTCTADDPDGTCSASASPDGTLVGFADLASLTAGEVKISGELRTGAGSTKLAEATVTATDTHPNGPDCPAGGPQALVHVTPTGLR